MSEQEVEELDLDDSSAEGETVEETGDDAPEDTHKNKSNFKNLYKKAKQLEKELEQERLARLQAEKEVEAWRTENPDIIKDKVSGDELSGIKEQIFLVANPEAKAHFNKVKERSIKYGMPLEEAWEDVRYRLPKESTSTEDFSIKGRPKSDKIDYSKMTLEESAKLSPAERKKWREANGWNG